MLNLKSRGSRNGFVGVLIFSIGLLILWLRFRSQNPMEVIQKEMGQVMNPYNVRLWQAVAKHETGNFTSAIFNENRNLFGMKLPKIRQTKAIGENRGHAKFSDLSDSAKDQLLYLNYVGYKQVDSPEALVTWMQSKGYFTDTYQNYLNGVKRFL